jgi:hypothetical protein
VKKIKKPQTESWSISRDLNAEHSDYEAGVLDIQPCPLKTDIKRGNQYTTLVSGYEMHNGVTEILH